MRDVFFLLGAERAGLLLLELGLAAHPELAWDGDFDFAIDWDPSALGLWPPLVPYWQHLALSPRLRALELVIDPSLSFPELVRSLLSQRRARSCAPHFGVTVHRHYDRLRRLFPAARFVYVGRSGGRPAADPGGWTPLHESDREWRALAAQIDPSRRIELRYERLVGSLGRELARVCELLGVPFDARMLRAALPLDGLPHQEVPALPPAALPNSARRFVAAFGQRVAQLLEGDS